MMFLALFIGFLVWKKIGKEKEFNSTQVLEFYIWVIIGLFIGNRIFHLLVYNFNYFISDPLGALSSTNGFASHGGIIGGTLAAYFFCKKEKLPFWKWADLAIVPIALVAGFVRIGNFLNGEIVGKVTAVPWAVNFPKFEGLRHPVQLYEAAKNFLIFGILYGIKGLNLPRGFIYWSFIFLFSFLRFFIEFFKEYLVFSSGLDIGQWISLVLITISGPLLYLIYTKKIRLEEN